MKICILVEEVRSFNLLNRLLHEFLGFTPAMILKILFYNVNILGKISTWKMKSEIVNVKFDLRELDSEDASWK
jgi:hypothetical protein